MIRNCALAAVLWLVLVAGYAFLLRTAFGLPERAIVSLVMGTIVWVAALNVNSARYTLREWRARNRMARGERPQDGEVVSAVGTIRPLLDALLAPLSGTECVAYSYKIATDSSSADCAGFGMTRCAVHTPYGAFQLGSFPILGEFFRESGEPERARAYLASTRFEPLEGFVELTKQMFALHTAAPPIRKDWCTGPEPNVDVLRAGLLEQAIPRDAIVTVVGRFVAATGAIVSDAHETGYLRVTPGGDARRESPFPWAVVQKVIVGLLAIFAANAVLYWWFRSAVA
jgi:hypothetical protein